MAKVKITCKLVSNNLATVTPAVRKRAADVIRQTAIDVSASAKTKAPVDTGNLKNSIHARTQGALLNLQATVTVGADYGLPVEEGHVAGKHGAFVEGQPFLAPAVEEHRESYEAGIAAALKGGCEDASQ